MPNWCSNTLVISGPANPLSDFIAQMSVRDGQPTLLLNDHYPLPAEEADNWYDWRVEHWGTKWDLNPEDTEVAILPETPHWVGRIEAHFQTAWTPPEAWMAHVSECHPALTFRLTYDEDGCDFGGEKEMTDGEITYERTGRSRNNMEREEEEADALFPDAPFLFIEHIGQDGRLEGEIYSHTYTDEWYETEIEWGFTIRMPSGHELELSGTRREALLAIREHFHNLVDTQQLFDQLITQGYDPTNLGRLNADMGYGIRIRGVNRDEETEMLELDIFC